MVGLFWQVPNRRASGEDGGEEAWTPRESKRKGRSSSWESRGSRMKSPDETKEDVKAKTENGQEDMKAENGQEEKDRQREGPRCAKVCSQVRLFDRL